MWSGNGGSAEVDVFVTSYNHGAWVQDTVNSLIAQRFRKLFNIYVYDDHSSLRGSRQCLWDIRDHGVDVVLATENVGVCRARNNIVQRGRAPWILFVDGDDHLNEFFLEKAWIAAHVHKLDVVYPKIAIFSDGAYVPHGTVDQGDFNLLRLSKSNYIPVTSLIRRSLFESSMFDEDMHHGFEDWELWLRLAISGAEFGFEPAAILYYRHHPNARSIIANQRYQEVYNYIVNKHSATIRKLTHPIIEWED